MTANPLHESAPPLLLLSPYGKDASLIVNRLQSEHVAVTAFDDMATLVNAIDGDAGAVMIAEEALHAGVDSLASVIESQPPWSDLPILVLTQPGVASPFVERTRPRLGNAVFIDRPVRVSTLVSTVLNALRARLRQYQTRAHLLALEEADRRKDVFFATLAHELRNPLAPIRSVTEILKRSSELPERLRRPVEIVERQVMHLSRLVDDLLEMSRITRGVVELRRAPVLLDTLLAQAVESVEPLCTAAGHRLEVVAPSEAAWLDVDAIRIVQVLANLLNNAVKYTDRGGSIRVAAHVGELAEIRVSDSGIGIEAALLPRVFDLFSQADTFNRRAQGGLGIGLTLVRTLVEMHGGTVSADSPGLGRGSTFTVRLPIPALSANVHQTPSRL